MEGAVVLAYCNWRKSPLIPIFLTSFVANIITQSLLWMVLQTFFLHYLAALLISELSIWIIESFLLYIPPGNQLKFGDAVLLSFSMNLLSFGVGWYLPV